MSGTSLEEPGGQGVGAGVRLGGPEMSWEVRMGPPPDPMVPEEDTQDSAYSCTQHDDG